VYVHYVPLKGFESIGTSTTVVGQMTKLANRIRHDAGTVQATKASTEIRFDTKQLFVAVHYAFAHLVSSDTQPFDFSQCVRLLSIPDSTEGHFSDILGYCLDRSIGSRFDATAKILASSFLRHMIYETGGEYYFPNLPSAPYIGMAVPC
jgi:hypothetical protein